MILVSLAAAATASPQIVPYEHVEIAAEPYVHQEPELSDLALGIINRNKPEAVPVAAPVAPQQFAAPVAVAPQQSLPPSPPLLPESGPELASTTSVRESLVAPISSLKLQWPLPSSRSFPRLSSFLSSSSLPSSHSVESASTISVRGSLARLKLQLPLPVSSSFLRLSSFLSSSSLPSSRSVESASTISAQQLP